MSLDSLAAWLAASLAGWLAGWLRTPLWAVYFPLCCLSPTMQTIEGPRSAEAIGFPPQPGSLYTRPSGALSFFSFFLFRFFFSSSVVAVVIILYMHAVPVAYILYVSQSMCA